MNLNDIINAIARQAIAAKTNIRTTSLGFIFAILYLSVHLYRHDTITLDEVEIAIAIAGIGVVAKDATKTGIPPHDVLTPRDNI